MESYYESQVLWHDTGIPLTHLAPSKQELYVKCNGFRTFSNKIFAIGTRDKSEYSILDGSLLLINK